MANTEEIKKAKKRRRAQIRKAAKKSNKTVAEYKTHPSFLKAWPEIKTDKDVSNIKKVTAKTPEVKAEEPAPEAEEENLFEENEVEKAS